MKAKLLRPADGDGGIGPDGRHIIHKLQADHVVDHPEAYLLVRQGLAEAADAECAAAVGMTGEQLARARRAYARADSGIHPVDFEAFEAGAMIGYDADGNWVAGPNLEAWLAAHPDSDEEDEDEEDE